MKEFKHLKFPNTKEGQEEKIEALEEYSEEGWRVVSETITPGKFRGGDACCLFLICAPCAFLAGSTDGEINVTIERELTEEIRKNKEAERIAELESLEIQKDKWKKLALWTVIAIASLIALSNLSNGNFITAIAFFLIAAILFPNTKKFLRDKYNFNLSKTIKIISVIVLFIVALIALPNNQNTNQDTNSQLNKAKTPEMIKAEKEAHAKAKAEQAKANAERAKAEAEWKVSRAGQICQNHPSWKKSDCEGLANNKIWIGMTYDILIYLRGKPNHVNVSNYGSGNHYQWCWDDYTPSCFYGDSDGVIASYN